MAQRALEETKAALETSISAVPVDVVPRAEFDTVCELLRRREAELVTLVAETDEVRSNNKQRVAQLETENASVVRVLRRVSIVSASASVVVFGCFVL